jgi:shikimate 5-dehydrogenase
MTEKKARLSRRNFLVTLGAGGAATAAAIATKNSAPSAQSPTKDDKRATRGYQAESGHVNNYYRTTKV